MGNNVRTVLGYGVQDFSVGMDLHVSGAVVCMGATRRGDRGDVCENAGVDIACVHFYAICAEHRYECMICWGVEFNTMRTVALIQCVMGSNRNGNTNCVPGQPVFYLLIQVCLQVQTGFVGAPSQIHLFPGRSGAPPPSGPRRSKCACTGTASLYMTMLLLQCIVKQNYGTDMKKGHALMGTLFI